MARRVRTSTLDWAAVLGASAAIVTSAALICVASTIMCHATWDDFGKVTWGPLAGCRIELPDGRKMPTGALRDVHMPTAPAPAASK